jgi:hypothetical protein
MHAYYNNPAISEIKTQLFHKSNWQVWDYAFH